MLGAFADDVEQAALFLLQIFLTVGAALFIGSGGGGSPLAALAACARCGRRRRCGSRSGCADVSELLDHGLVQRHDEQIVVAHEANFVRLIMHEVRLGFDVRGLRQLAPQALLVVVEEEVTGLGVDGPLLIFAAFAGRWRRQFRFFVRQLS